LSWLFQFNVWSYEMNELKVHYADWLLMEQHVASEQPYEACGLLGGRSHTVKKVIPVDNISPSPVRFHMHPGQQVQALFELEDAELDLLGIYHSHPAGYTEPSKVDIAEWRYPKAYSLIWTPRRESWVCHAYRLSGGVIHIVDLVISESPGESAQLAG
jgi:proteasome lid subunit RPN8/RPN11